MPIRQARQHHVFVVVDFSQSVHRDMLRGVIDFVLEYAQWVLTYGQDLRAPKSISPGEVDRRRNNDFHAPSRPTGVIGFIEPRHRKAFLRRNIRHVVSVSSVFDLPGIGHVVVDNHRAGAMAAAHLIAQGFRHLAVFHQTDAALWGVGFEERLSGVRAEADKHGVSLDCRTAQTGAVEWIRSLPKPVGIVTVIDRIAVELIQIASGLGLHVPTDLAVVGMDNDDLLCNMVRPTLTSIDMNFRRIGYEAATMLDRAMKTHRPPQNRVVIPPGDLICRGSSDVIVSPNPLVTEAMRYIIANAHKPIGVNDIASGLAVGLSTLEVNFRRWRGTTPLAELTRVRLDRAHSMLHSTDQSVKAIAIGCGFGNYRNLNRWFKHTYGKTANEYRIGLARRR